MRAGLVVVAVVVLGCTSLAPLQAQQVRRSRELNWERIAWHIVCSRWPNLSNLTKPGLSSQKRLELGLFYARWLTNEPPPAHIGGGSGPYDASYAKSQIFQILGMEVDLADLQAAQDVAQNPDLWDWLAVALGYGRDPAVTDDLRRIMAHASDGYMRWQAARLLAGQKDPALAADLRAALSDPFVIASHGPDVGPQGPWRFYPVRDAAALGLRLLGEEVPEEVYKVRLEVRDEAEMYSHMFDGLCPQSCLTGVQVLGTLGERGRTYLEGFVRDNGDKEDLAEAVEAARKTLARPVVTNGG